MEAVDQLRRNEITEKGKEHKQLMNHTRYIWLKNPWNLTDKQKVKLGSLEKLNLKINRAYLLKEAFRNLWFKTARRANRYLTGAMLPPDEDLIEELQTPTYEVQNGKIRVMPKDVMRELLLQSPDKADSLCLTFYEDSNILIDPTDLRKCAA